MKIKLTLTRVYVNEIDSAIDFYEKLIGEKCSNRFSYEQNGLELALVSNFLLISGSEEALSPFRGTSATLLVDSLEEYRKFLLANGATIVRDIQKVPTGYNMTMQHKDGIIVEYVEHV